MKKNKHIVVDFEHDDPFFDNYSQEIFVCHDIIDSLRVIEDKNVTVTIEKEFLQKMLYSYIHKIRNL